MIDDCSTCSDGACPGCGDEDKKEEVTVEETVVEEAPAEETPTEEAPASPEQGEDKPAEGGEEN